MSESFAKILEVGGKSNSLGRAGEVVETVLLDKSRLDELYNCFFEADPWVRMRAIDSFEKVCRVHPEWFVEYTDRLLDEVSKIDQASIQWHLAQLFNEIELTLEQKQKAISLLGSWLEAEKSDWIVAANAMVTLAQFTRNNWLPKEKLLPILIKQKDHRSKAVVKRADKLLKEFEN